MALPRPQLSHTRTRTDATSGPHEGRYTLIAALETAIAANPGLAHALYPDGHGGHIEPPDSALRYRPTTALADCVRQRDRTCRHPGCDVPAAGCEIDHVIPYNHRNPARGGWTILTNLHCLCKYHHSLKTMGAWTPTMLAGAVNYWESSSGTTAITLPGSAIGTTDCAEQPLIPHIPRKRRPKCETVPETAAEAAVATGSTALAGSGSGSAVAGSGSTPAESGSTPAESGSALGQSAVDTAKRTDPRTRNRRSSTRKSAHAAGSGSGAEAGSGAGAAGSNVRSKRPRIHLEPIVGCNESMGTAVGLIVGTAISAHRGGAPF